eukprot:EG_transcript_23385
MLFIKSPSTPIKANYRHLHPPRHGAMEGGCNGWKNGVQYCQRNLEATLALARETADGYIDDILIGTTQENLGTVEQLLKRHNCEIHTIFDLLRQKQWVARFPKCKFFQNEVEFLGHISRDGLRKPSPGKLLGVEKWELP